MLQADGREVQLSMIFPCLLGARMLGSTAVPWFFNGPLSAPLEDILIAVFCMAGLAISVVAYDYQVRMHSSINYSLADYFNKRLMHNNIPVNL